MAVCVAAVVGAVGVLESEGVWRAIGLLMLVPFELAVVFAAVTRPGGATGAPLAHPDVEVLKRALRVRADVRVSASAELFGGKCVQRWGRDVVVVAPGGFEHRELMAVVAHEFGHTKQSAVAKAVWVPAKRLTWSAVWLWGVQGSWLLQLGGVALGAALVAWLMFLSGLKLRFLGQVVAWAVWVTQLSEQPWGPLAAGVGVWVVLRLVEALHSRVSELLADEAVKAVAGGPEALSSALARVAGPQQPWWRRVWATHPHPQSRGAARARLR